jgi:phage-related minor tail protein
MQARTFTTPADVERPSNGRAVTAAPSAVETAAHQAFWLLRATFTVAPILFGVDKFFNWTVHWPDYLAGWINEIQPFASGQSFMYFVGAVEIAAGLLVAFAPRIGAFVVAGWLLGIVVNLLTKNAPQYYDIALRDFGLMLAALTLGRLSLVVVPARKSGALPPWPW